MAHLLLSSRRRSRDLAEVLSKRDRDCSPEEVEQPASSRESSKKRLSNSLLLSSFAPLQGKIPISLLPPPRPQRSSSDVASIPLFIVEEDREISLGNWPESKSDMSKAEGEGGTTAGFDVQSVLETSVSSSPFNQVESEESNIAADAIDESISIALNVSGENMTKKACKVKKRALKTKCLCGRERKEENHQMIS